MSSSPATLLAQALEVSHCPMLPPWATHGQSRVLAQLRRSSTAGFLAHSHPHARPIAALALLATWPARVGWQAWHNTQRHGATVFARHQTPRARQFLEQVRLGLRYCVPTESYYREALFLDQQPPEHLTQGEARGLFNLLNAGARHLAIEDKTEFALWAQSHDIAHIPTLGLVHPGADPSWPQRIAAPARLFVKPTRGARGQGCSLWTLRGDTMVDNAGKLHDLARWQTQRCASGRTWLVQPQLLDHPRLRSKTGLSTLRVITARTPDGATETIAATHKSGWRSPVHNNSGLSAAVDLDTGRLGRAFSYHPLCSGYARHPVDGPSIEGTQIPDWPRARALAERAHRVLGSYVFLGWDVAVTADGPVLVEGNSGWEVDSIQRTHARSLAQGRFADISQSWLQRMPG